MTGTWACGEIRLELGIYVLGAIEAAGRSAVDAHLARCIACRNELAELTGLPGLLSRVTADEAASLGPDRGLIAAGAGAVAASARYKTVPYRTCRTIMGKQGGDSAR